MTQLHGGRPRFTLGWWIALLSLVLAFAPLESFAARNAPAKKVTASAKAKSKAKSRSTAKAKSKSRATAKKSAKSRGKAKASARGAKKKVVSAKSKSKKRVVSAKARKAKRTVAAKRPPPPLPASPDKLPLAASVAYVIDAESNEVLLSKNDDDVRPIASLTKLMTALIVSDAQLPLDETLDDHPARTSTA